MIDVQESCKAMHSSQDACKANRSCQILASIVFLPEMKKTEALKSTDNGPYGIQIENLSEKDHLRSREFFWELT